MPLKKRNRVLLISIIILSLLMFVFVFLKPSMFSSIMHPERKLPTKASKQGYVIAKDPGETYALEVPGEWLITPFPVGNTYTSQLAIKSPDFKLESPIEDEFGLLGVSMTSGASLDISVVKSHEESVPKPATPVTREEAFKVDDLNGTYYVYNDSGLANAEFHEVRFAKNGHVYFIKMTFNPEAFSEGEKFFKYILSTLVIK